MARLILKSGIGIIFDKPSELRDYADYLIEDGVNEI
jgi:hypothetical protein